MRMLRRSSARFFSRMDYTYPQLKTPRKRVSRTIELIPAEKRDRSGLSHDRSEAGGR